MKYTWKGSYLSLQAADGALLNLDSVHGVQFGINEIDTNYCESKYTIKDSNKQVKNGLTLK